MKHILLGIAVLILSLFSLTGQAQESTQDDSMIKPKELRSRPDIPGDVMIELGFNFLLNAPETIKPSFWGSKAVNVYYLFDFPIGKSHFSFHTGLGLGLDKYDFSNPVTLAIDDNNKTTTISLEDAIGAGIDFRKSKLAANYVDLPIEFRFLTNPNDANRSFKVALGGRVGVLYSAHTKVVYKTDGQIKKLKDQQGFNLSPIRYGVYGRLGIGNVNLFYNYYLNSLFKSEDGPERTDVQPMTFGISITGF